MIQPDTSTINQKALRRFPVYNKPLTYEISRSMGAGCYGDAPGYPSYFLQNVYTAHGNTPSRGPQFVIRDDAGVYHAMPDFWGKGADRRDAILHKLWLPLSVDHVRVQTWIQHVYQQAAHCYTALPGDRSDRHVIWPVRKFWLPTRPEPFIETHYGETKVRIDAAGYRKMLTAYRTEVKNLLRAAWDVAKNPGNHLAVARIRKFYPEHVPDLALIANPPRLLQADWWERYANLPSEAECPGHLGHRHGEYNHCGMCGRQGIKQVDVLVRHFEHSTFFRHIYLKPADFDYQVDGFEDQNVYTV